MTNDLKCILELKTLDLPVYARQTELLTTSLTLFYPPDLPFDLT